MILKQNLLKVTSLFFLLQAKNTKGCMLHHLINVQVSMEAISYKCQLSPVVKVRDCVLIRQWCLITAGWLFFSQLYFFAR